MSDTGKRPSTGRGEDGAFWTIIGYLFSGLLLWGGGGYFLDKWLGTSYLAIGGMLLGVTSAIYLIWLRFISK
jgi:F0F1-type ATP synthase assembly protein I